MYRCPRHRKKSNELFLITFAAATIIIITLFVFPTSHPTWVLTFDLHHFQSWQHLRRRRLVPVPVVSKISLSQSRWKQSMMSTTDHVSDTSIDSDNEHQQQHQHQHQQQQQHPEQELLRRIPYEQRVTQPRLARRMNHPFKYLFRHGFDDNVLTIQQQQQYNNTTLLDMEDPYTFLHVYGTYTHEQIIAMNESFPMLLQLSVRQQLYPKIQFLKHTIFQQKPMDSATMSTLIPPYYYGARLERILAPRHAFLVWTQMLPFGLQLLEPIHNDSYDPAITELTPKPNNDRKTTIPNKFHEFLYNCRNTKHFAAMCQKWANEHLNHNCNTSTHSNVSMVVNITAKDIEAFDMIFGRGLLSICRNDLVQDNNTWAMDQLQQPPKYTVHAADLIPILIMHGSNVYERDHRGATLLHWACGTGHIDIVQQLIPYFDDNVTNTITTRDGATPLHWSAAGCNTREFGIGGHVHICEYLLHYVRTSSSSSSSSLTVHDFINQCTYDGNSPLMWAAWSGTIETVKLLVRNKANTTLINRNGCSVAHWAASGGNVEVCQYLYNVANVDFTRINYGGNTPLSHAVAFGRTDVVDWLLQGVDVQNEDKMLLYTLAQDFVEWTDGEEKQKRSEILQQFDDNGWI